MPVIGQDQYYCYKCLWFRATDDSDPNPNNWVGRCQRYAPHPVQYPLASGVASDDSLSASFQAVDNTTTHWVWPYCRGGGAWFCGDFKPYDENFTS